MHNEYLFFLCNNNLIMDGKKLRIGWFTFNCCEDSTIIFTELLNTHYREWKNMLDFIHAKVIRSANRWEEMDVAFVEGAISSAYQEERLKKIRGLSKKLVAIGSCACTGMPSAQRNQFDSPTKEEIKELLEQFKQSDRVKKLEEVVTVDDKVQGCPMTEEGFLKVLDKYLAEFGIKT
jgi:coenzyme F420-reducing hydrogenase gamma subunit